MIKKDLNEINKEDVLCSVPYFPPERITFRRDEKNGYISIQSLYAPKLHELFLNKSSQLILELCDGNRKVDDIIFKVHKMYNNVTIERVKEDVISALLSLYKYQLITWKGVDPFMYTLKKKMDNKSFCVAEEGDIRRILTFIKKGIDNDNLMQYIHPLTIKEIYCDELYIRDMLFNYEEDFYFLIQEDEIVGLISLRFSKNVRSNVSSIGIILCESQYLELILKCLVEYSVDVSQRDICKIKSQILEELGFISQSKLENALKNVGFEFECLLKKEVDFKNLKIYSYYL